MVGQARWMLCYMRWVEMLWFISGGWWREVERVGGCSWICWILDVGSSQKDEGIVKWNFCFLGFFSLFFVNLWCVLVVLKNKLMYMGRFLCAVVGLVLFCFALLMVLYFSSRRVFFGVLFFICAAIKNEANKTTKNKIEEIIVCIF